MALSNGAEKKVEHAYINIRVFVYQLRRFIMFLLTDLLRTLQSLWQRTSGYGYK